MYDEESGLYYLESRYYDPVTGRFVNADGYVSTGTGLMGHNMFAYCNNNPVMYVDPTGARPVNEIQADIDVLEAFIKEARYAIANQTTTLNAEDMLHYAQRLSALKQELADALVVWPIDEASPNDDYPYYSGTNNPHTGTDFPAPTGTQVRAASSGTIIEVSTKINFNTYGNPNYTGMDTYGIHIFIRTNKGVEMRYAHLSEVYVSEGQYVNAWDVIGAVGNTGNSSAPHLHFEVRENGVTVNPYNYLP